MRTMCRLLTGVACVLCISLTLPVVTAHLSSPDQEAKEILDAGGVQGGLIVHLGCGDGKLTASLGAGANYLVHGLDTNAETVRRARENIRKLGGYGPVSVEVFDGKRLPYVENMVNLIVAGSLGDITVGEAMRVLAPGGTLYVREDGGWSKTIKPRAAKTDEWTHFLHDASGNAVAHDEVVGPPRHVQWIAGPRHTRSHEHTPSINAVVSTGGRIFYIADQTPAASIRRPPKWHIVARDAYNGIILWKRPVSAWYPHIVNWGAAPRQLQRRLVAVGNRVYVTPGLHEPLSALDAATGETVKVYEDTRGTEEVLWHKGILLLAARSVTAERAAELEKWAQLTKDKKSPLHARETAEPLLKRFRSIEGKSAKAILALDADTGGLLWKKTGTDAAALRPVSLCAGGDRVFYQKGGDVVCVDLKRGRELWSAQTTAPLRLVYDARVVCADGRSVTVLSAETGKTLWSQPASLTEIRDVFVAGGSLWIGGFKPCEGKRGPVWGPYFATQRDPTTGKILMHIEPKNPGHHHRCWQNKATDRYILAGRRGVEFIDLQTGDVLWHSWVRGVCKYGVMPCNGLLYAPPHACGCYIAAKLTSFYALAHERDSRFAAGSADKEPLERGPAYSEGSAIRQSATHTKDWPTYRRDAQRSGSASCSVPFALRRRWRANVGAKLSSCTVAGGKVFVASVDEHRVCAIDADSGRSIWDFTTGARVDSPPTLYANRAIFGCRDGHVYSLRTSDGALAWRLRAARTERRISVYGQLESPSPIHGSVLVQDDVAYFTAGRSSYLDGGIDLCRLDARTGKTLPRTRIYSPDPETGKQPEQYGPAYMPGSLGEILTSDGEYVYLRDMVLDTQGRNREKGNPHLLTLTGFLDDSWPHRSYWIYGARCSLSTGCSGRDRNLIFGRLLVLDEPMIYGYGRATVHWSNRLQDGAYRLFARRSDEPKAKWTKDVPIQVRAMVLADGILFAAGPTVNNSDGSEGQGQPLLLAISAADARELARYRLDSSPVFDGMAAANDRLYLSLENGQVCCMAGRSDMQ
ncbi:MAG: PQQ-binding-like beta-propeller repeat protein [Phycisphaerae bacterium]|nr:PQQ-binding-like beta-propeller repeat protein [Phycisphaerae bacterium]